MNCLRYILIVLLFCFSLKAQEFEEIHNTKQISVERIHSDVVDDSFLVYTKLPEGYNDSNKTYPVLYLMDGDILFSVAVGTTQYLHGGGYIPEMILVGVGYGTMDWREGNNRSRDFTPIASEGRPFEGGGEKFLRFMSDELIPRIDEKFRTDKENRILMGHSLGGQFVIYSLLNSPEIYSKYLASSPQISRIKEFYDSLLIDSRDEVNKYPKRVFISAGEFEDEDEYLNPVGDFVEQLRNRLDDNTEIGYKILPEGEHFLNPPTAMVFGLKWLFKE